jgi:hypothetical protein
MTGPLVSALAIAALLAGCVSSGRIAASGGGDVPLPSDGAVVVAAVGAIPLDSACRVARCARITISDTVRSTRSGPDRKYSLFVLTDADADAILRIARRVAPDVSIGGREAISAVRALHMSLGIAASSSHRDQRTVAISLLRSNGRPNIVFFVDVRLVSESWQVISVRRQDG